MTVRVVCGHQLSTRQLMYTRWPHYRNIAGPQIPYCVLALDEAKDALPRVVGWWSFNKPYSDARGIVMYSHYTRVQPAYRRDGLAMAMWEAGIKAWQADWVHATVGTPAGLRFLAAAITNFGEQGVTVDVSHGDDEENPYRLALERLLARRGQVAAAPTAGKTAH